MWHVCLELFFCRASCHADFIVPVEKYVMCTTSKLPVGTRFRMKFHFDDSPERRSHMKSHNLNDVLASAMHADCILQVQWGGDWSR